MTKTVVFGLDGGEPSLILRWRNELPNISRLMSNGVFAKMKSTIPPVTSPAWNSMITGKNPGKLGIFGFVNSNGGSRLSVTDFSRQTDRSVWDYVGDVGLPVCVVNVPVTFPPKPVNGIMVSGGLFMPLYKSVSFTYPKAIQKNLDKMIGGYEGMPMVDLTIEGRDDEYLGVLLQNIKKTGLAISYLTQHSNWEFLMAVFFPTDSAQHYFWHHLDDKHPKHNPRQSVERADYIKRIYKAVDSEIGRILGSFGKDINVFVVSDHGGGPLLGYFMVNEWLERKGLLTLRGRPKSRKENQPRKLLRSLAKRMPIPVAQKLVQLAPTRLLDELRAYVTYRAATEAQATGLAESIDWSTTKAYGGQSGGGNIRINLKGREASGSVEPGDYDEFVSQILGYLHEVTLPGTTTPAMTSVYRRGEIYNGNRVQEAPDILFTIDDCRYDQSLDLGRGVWAPSIGRSGWHQMNGIFVASGPGIQKLGEIEPVSIYDFAPTILKLIGVEIPDDMDGHALQVFSGSEQLSSARARVKERQELIRKISRLKSEVGRRR